MEVLIDLNNKTLKRSRIFALSREKEQPFKNELDNHVKNCEL